jgi:hypothetical protein
MVKVYDTALKKPKAALKINIYNSILFNSIEKINSLYQIYKNKFDNDKNENIQENMDRLQTLLKKYF